MTHKSNHVQPTNKQINKICQEGKRTRNKIISIQVNATK